MITFNFENFENNSIGETAQLIFVINSPWLLALVLILITLIIINYHKMIK